MNLQQIRAKARSDKGPRCVCGHAVSAHYGNEACAACTCQRFESSTDHDMQAKRVELLRIIMKAGNELAELAGPGTQFTWELRGPAPLSEEERVAMQRKDDADQLRLAARILERGTDFP